MERITGKYLYFLCVLISFLISGCGYTTGGTLAYKENNIFIAPVKNEINITSEDGRYGTYTNFPISVEKNLTNKVIEKFNIFGRLKLSNNPENSLRLHCVVTDYRKEALRYTDDEDVEEQRLGLYVNMKLFSSSGEVLKERTIVGDASFFLSGPKQKSESSAQQELVDDTARRILEAVIEDW